MRAIINLTQHQATAEQVAAGVQDMPAEMRAKVSELLTFTSLPTKLEISMRAHALAYLLLGATSDMAGAQSVMIGGAPYLMAPLEAALQGLGFPVLYAFSERVSSEEVQPDGSVRKVNTFRHAGFVPAVGGDL